MKRIVYVDMDNVLVNFESAFKYVPEPIRQLHLKDPDNIPGIFSLMDPMPCAIESFFELAEKFDAYVLSTAPWKNPSAWSDKLNWVRDHLGEHAHKRLIITHHKQLLQGDYLIDDRMKNGADRFKGELILFGSKKFPDWPAVMEHLRQSSGAPLF